MYNKYKFFTKKEIRILSLKFELDTTGEYLSLTKENVIHPAGKEQERTEKLFLSNIFLLAANRKRILTDAKMAFVHIPVRNGLAYTGALPQATLGIYAQWWDACPWSVLFEEEKMFVLWFISGSPMSGSNSCAGSDIDGNSKTIRCERFSKVWRSFVSVMDAFEELAPPPEIYTLDEVVGILRKETDVEMIKAEMEEFGLRSRLAVIDDKIDGLLGGNDKMTEEAEKAIRLLQTERLKLLKGRKN